MNKDKLKIFIGCFVLLLAIVLRIVLYDNNSSDNNDNSDKNIRYVMIDSYVMLSINNNRINFSDYDNEDVLKSKFNIYSDGNYFGKYYIRNLPTGLKIIDGSNNFIKNDGYLIGDTSNDSIRVSKINVEDAMISDYIFANDVLKDAGVSIGFNSSNSSFVKYRADYNNDGYDEYIYSISNMFSSDSVGYSILFTVIDNEYKIISKDVDNSSDGYEISIVGILDINNDNQLDIVVAKSKFGHDIECYEIYKSDNMKFKKIKGCK